MHPALITAVDFDQIASYASRDVVLSFAADPRYREAHRDREDGLSHTYIVATAPAFVATERSAKRDLRPA